MKVPYVVYMMRFNPRSLHRERRRRFDDWQECRRFQSTLPT